MCTCCDGFGHHHRTFDGHKGPEGEEYICLYCKGEPRKDCSDCKRKK